MGDNSDAAIFLNLGLKGDGR